MTLDNDPGETVPDAACWNEQPHPGAGFICTRPVGHTGEHQCAYASWPEAGTTPEPTWDEDRYPTADELLTWVLAHDTTTDNTRLLSLLAILLEDSERAHRCRMADHDAYPAQVHRLRRMTSDLGWQVSRYRSAWLSASRRARGAR